YAESRPRAPGVLFPSISSPAGIVPRDLSSKETAMAAGVVKFFNVQKGFGFITPETGGNDVFVHVSAVERSGLQTLKEGHRVSFEVERDRQGRPSAVNLKVG